MLPLSTRDILDSTDHQWMDVRNSPHVQQVLARHEQVEQPQFARCNALLGAAEDDDAKTDKKKNGSSSGALPRRAYQNKESLSAQGVELSVVHWGQLKLLLCEIEFLTMYAKDGDTVLYVGAADGRHIPYLANELFPKLTFVLFDPHPFAFVPDKEKKNILLRQEMFTDECVKEFQSTNRTLLFISDIRTTCFEKEDPSRDKDVRMNMDAQMKWYLALQPKRALLKFRFPYAKGQTKYLAGDIYFQPFARCQSTETRLVPFPPVVRERGVIHKQDDDDNDEEDEEMESEQHSDEKHESTTAEATENLFRLYDHQVYEEQMCHFNHTLRTGTYRHGVRKAPGLDHCYDCTTQVYILSQYLCKYHPYIRPEDRNEAVRRMSKAISYALIGNTDALALKTWKIKF